MALQHLHLHVRDRAPSEAFYAAWFGMTAERCGSEISFMTDEREFLAALMDDAAPAPLPAWVQFGMRLASAGKVLALHERMAASAVAICKPLYQGKSLVSYRWADSDGHVIEVYWEAERAAG
jgi:hypothetical protein